MSLKQELIDCFNEGLENDCQMIGVLVDIKNYDYSELIVNNRQNIKKKLEYYKETYDKNLSHRHADNICITDFAYARNPRELFKKLDY